MCLVAEFISPKKCTLLVLKWVVLSQKVQSVSTQLLRLCRGQEGILVQIRLSKGLGFRA